MTFNEPTSEKKVKQIHENSFSSALANERISNNF